MIIKWLDPIIVNGVAFRKGDNGEQLFYDTEANGLTWTIMRPHIHNPVMPGFAPPYDGFCHVPYWSAYVEDANGAIKLLNSADLEYDGVIRNKGPLYGITDSGYVDPPMQLLEGIAGMIADGVDPWTSIVKEQIS